MIIIRRIRILSLLVGLEMRPVVAFHLERLEECLGAGIVMAEETRMETYTLDQHEPVYI